MILNWILAEAWPYIAGVGAAALALLFAFMRGRSSGIDGVERDQEASASEQRRKINEADTKLAEMGDDDIRRRLGEWVRDDKVR